MYFDRGVVPLPDTECRGLLAAVSAGRVSVSVGGLPVVVPVAYRCHDADVVAVTGDGAARRAAVRGDVVALEVESEIGGDGGDAWAVLVIGRCCEIDATEAAAHGVAGLRPRSGVADTHFIRITPEIVTGYRTPAGV